VLGAARPGLSQPNHEIIELAQPGAFLVLAGLLPKVAKLAFGTHTRHRFNGLVYL
jgi:hypothetical protein